jgi:hypothetical protein
MSGSPQQGCVAHEEQNDGHAERDVDEVGHSLLPPEGGMVTLVLPMTVRGLCGTTLRDINEI